MFVFFATISFRTECTISKFNMHEHGEFVAQDCSSKVLQLNNSNFRRKLNYDRTNFISFVYSLRVCVDFVSLFLCMSNNRNIK